MRFTKPRKKLTVGRVVHVGVTQLILILLALMSLFPFIWMLGSSLKENSDSQRHPSSL